MTDGKRMMQKGKENWKGCQDAANVMNQFKVNIAMKSMMNWSARTAWKNTIRNGRMIIVIDECKTCTNSKRCSPLDKALMTACKDFRRKNDTKGKKRYEQKNRND